MDGGQVLVVMGVSGSGKSTVAALVAERLGWMFVDGDSFHTPEHIAKMHAGFALDDEDRAPWLARIAVWIRQRLEAGESGVASCQRNSVQSDLDAPERFRQPVVAGLIRTYSIDSQQHGCRLEDQKWDCSGDKYFRQGTGILPR